MAIAFTIPDEVAPRLPEGADLREPTDWLMFGPLGSCGRHVVLARTRDGHAVRAGCWTGTCDELAQKIKDGDTTWDGHRDAPRYAAEYKIAVKAFRRWMKRHGWEAREAEEGFAKGDRVRTADHRELMPDCRNKLGTVQGPESDGYVSVRLDKGQSARDYIDVSFLPRRLTKLDSLHGFCVGDRIEVVEHEDYESARVTPGDLGRVTALDNVELILTMDNGKGWWCNGTWIKRHEPRRPTVGDTVRVRRARQQEFVGVIQRDDGDSSPYTIDGRGCYRESEVTPFEGDLYTAEGATILRDGKHFMPTDSAGSALSLARRLNAEHESVCATLSRDAGAEVPF